MQATAQVSSSLLLMAVMGLLFPAALHATGTELQMGESELALSRFSSIVMLVAYTAYLYFQLKSHRTLYDQEVSKNLHLACVIQYSKVCIRLNPHNILPWCFQGDEDEEPSNGEHLSFWTWIGWLAILTLFISILSEYLVDAIEVCLKPLECLFGSSMSSFRGICIVVCASQYHWTYARCSFCESSFGSSMIP